MNTWMARTVTSSPFIDVVWTPPTYNRYLEVGFFRCNARMSKRISAIESRNARVEADKAREQSWTRRLVLAGFTCVVVLAILLWIRADQAFLVALVPAVACLISTLTLGFAKKWWLARR